MKHDLYELAYLSRNNENRSDMASVVRDILVVACSTNLRLAVTGALLFSRGHFAQVLEGSRASVETVFEAIQRDPRHRDVNVLYFNPIEKRDFADWSMAFAGLLNEAVLPFNVDGVYANQDSIAAGKIGLDIVKILKALINRQELAGALSQNRC
jgi:hypothetical protein